MFKELFASFCLILLLVQLSEQQFSYSANWGKRSSDSQYYDLQCKKLLKVKEFLGSAENVEEQILVI